MSSYKSINPFTFEVLASFESLNAEQWKSKLNLGHRTFSTYRTTSFDDRSKMMRTSARLLLERKSELAKLITLEMGKQIGEAEAEISKCAMVCEHYARYTENYLRSQELDNVGHRALLVHDPIGVVLAVMPWNFPFWQVFRFAAPALMAGNVGLLKHASNVPQCALAIESIFLDAGFPKGCFQNLFINTEDIPALIEDDRVVAVTLTGSEQAGSKVAESAGKFLKKSVLELGGNDPFIVLPDANIDEAVDIAVRSRFLNAGQSCIAAKRFIIHDDVYESFKLKFGHAVKKLTVGDPLNETTDMGPMARTDLATELQAIVNEAVVSGAKVVVAGGVVEGGALFHPMILENVTSKMNAYGKELFGPVAILYNVSSEKEAIALANDTPYGLGASIWTRNHDNAIKVSREINSGAVFINTMVASNPYLPFGGVKKSGYGRELADLGIKEFVNIKTLVINDSL